MDCRNSMTRPQSRTHGWIVRVAVIIVALGGVAVVAALGLNRGLNSDTSGGTGGAVDQFEVRLTSFDLVIPASGELESKEKIEIRNKVEGRTTIKWVIDEGTTVKKGDLLVELVSEDLENRIRSEEISVRERESRYTAAVTALDIQRSQNESAMQKAKTQETLARLELEKWLSGDDVTRMKDLDLAIEKAQRNQKRYDDDYQESIKLEAEGFISASQLTDDYIRMIEANAELEKALLAKETYIEYTRKKEKTSRETDLQQAIDELGRVEKQNNAQLTAKQDAVNSELDQLNQMKERLKGWQEQLDACTVYAPSDGLVVYGTTGSSNRPWRMEDPLMIGLEVYSNQLLITLPDIVRMKAAVKVHESQSNQVRPGMPARVKVDAMPDLSLSGRVLSVGVMAQQSFGSQVREYSVDIEIEPDNIWELKPSMRCKADIFLGRVDDVLAVPVTGVFSDRGRHSVWKRVARGRYEKSYVTIGRASESMIELKDGIQEGEVILLREPEPGEIVGGQDDQQSESVDANADFMLGETEGGQPRSGRSTAAAPAAVAGGPGARSGRQRMRPGGSNNNDGQQPQRGERGTRPGGESGHQVPTDESSQGQESQTQTAPAKPGDEG